MRFDTAGLFWDDTPAPRLTKPPEPKREPPPRTWESPDYLPYLDEARTLPIKLLSPDDLNGALAAREKLICDSEIYGNYFLVAFTSVVSGKVIYFECTGEEAALSEMDRARLKWILENFTVVTFNGNFFDLPIIALALAGYSCAQLKYAANQIIGEDQKPWQVLKARKVKKLTCDHIDLIEVAPLQASLKIYGGRLHVPRMQELPFRHDVILSADQIAIVRWYCIGSDLTATAFLYMELKAQIELRASMSQMYGVDLRSKSDAQIAEAVLTAELQRLTYTRPQRPENAPTEFRYKVPDYIQFEDEGLRRALATVAAATFRLGAGGGPELPEEVKALKIEFGGATYQMGIGGLHSCEKSQAHWSDDEHILVDRDVTSYYPNIILNQKLYPQHLGPAFLEVYKTLVERRQLAKKTKNKVEADTIKIVVNGAFGKLGSPWSVLFAPDLMVQVTISGQLSLLMLIERLHCFGAGVQICSANTDGVLIRCHKSKRALMLKLIAQWEKETGFTTEETEYRAVFARDVNNYFGVKMGGGCKLKGVYSEKGSAGDSVLSKNPESLICNDAVVNFLTVGTPIKETIWSCRDVRRFVTVRNVTGGAVKDGEYLGKAIRYYYAADLGGEIIYASSGNKVPNSDSARPCMQLPTEAPADLDFARYERDALAILAEVGYPMPDELALVP